MILVGLNVEDARKYAAERGWKPSGPARWLAGEGTAAAEYVYLAENQDRLLQGYRGVTVVMTDRYRDESPAHVIAELYQIAKERELKIEKR